MKKAQVSVEYLFVVGFSLLILIPILLVYSFQTQDLTDKVRYSMAKDAATYIVQNAELVHYLGEPSLIEITVAIPEGIEGVSLNSTQLTFHMTRGSDGIDVVELSNVNITGSILATSGKHNLRLQSVGNQINISEI